MNKERKVTADEIDAIYQKTEKAFKDLADWIDKAEPSDLKLLKKIANDNSFIEFALKRKLIIEKKLNNN